MTLLRSTVALALALTVSASAQEVTTVGFPADVELVTVDVVVVDKKGNAVEGLNASDFTILDEGTPQAIERFEAVVLPTEPPPPLPVRRAAYSTNQTPKARLGRTFVIVFDDLELSPAQALRARAAVAGFLQTGIREGDRVTLIATGGGAWWSAHMPAGRDELVAILKRLKGRHTPDSFFDSLTDWEAMRIMAYDDAEVAYQVMRRFDAFGAVARDRNGERTYADTRGTGSLVGMVDPYVRTRAEDYYRQSVARRKAAMGVMKRALQALGETRGRKGMILVSEGWVHEPDFKPTRELVEASLRANVPIYFVDTRGLTALPEAFTAAFPGANTDIQDTVSTIADMTREAEGAEGVAADTGGFSIKNSNDLEAGLRRVSTESEAFYLLGYRPTSLERDGRFHKITIKLTGDESRDRKIRARRGYFAPLPDNARPEEAPDRTDPEIVRALDSPFERKEIPVRVAAYTFEEAESGHLNVMIAAEIDVRGLAFEEREGKSYDVIDYSIEAQHRETGEFLRQEDKIELNLLPQTRESLDREGYILMRSFSLSPGSYQIKVVVRDAASRRLGSVIHELDVPSPDVLRITSPIITDRLQSNESEGSVAVPRPVLDVRREFAPGATLYVQYHVVGAEHDPATQQPRVSGGYEVRSVDGAIIKSAPLTRIAPTPAGALSRFMGIRLSAPPEGEYDLVIKIKDEVSGKELEVAEPFVLRSS